MPLNSNKKSSRKAKILPQFSIPPENRPHLDLLEIQRKSFFDLLEHGIPFELAKTGIFRETAKNSLFTQELELVLNPKTYTFISPNFTPKQAILKGKTYACKLYVQATLIIRSHNPEGFANQQISAQERKSTGKQNCLNYNSVDSSARYYLAAYPSTFATYALRFPFGCFARPEGQLRKRFPFGSIPSIPFGCLPKVAKASPLLRKPRRGCGILVARPQANELDQTNGMPRKRRYVDIPKLCRAEYSQNIVNQYYVKLIKKGLSNFSRKILDLDINSYSATEKLQAPSVSKKSIRLTDPIPHLLRKPFALQGACYQYPFGVRYAGVHFSGDFSRNQSIDQFNKGDTVTELEILTNFCLTKFTRELEVNKTGIDFFYQVIQKEEKCRKYGLLEIPVSYSLNTAWGYNSYLLRKAASFGVRNTLKLRNKEKIASIEVTSQTLFNLFSKHLLTYLSLSKTRYYLRYVSNLCKLSQFPYLHTPPVPKATLTAIKYLKKKPSLGSSSTLSLVYPYLNSAKGILCYAANAKQRMLCMTAGHLVNKKQGLQPSNIFDMQRGTLTTFSCGGIQKMHSIRLTDSYPFGCFASFPFRRKQRGKSQSIDQSLLRTNGPILAISRGCFASLSSLLRKPCYPEGFASPFGVIKGMVGSTIPFGCLPKVAKASPLLRKPRRAYEVDGVLDSHKLISLVGDGSYTCAAINAFGCTGLRSTGLGNKEHKKEYHYPKGACFPCTSKKGRGKHIEDSPKERSWIQHIGGKKKSQTGAVPAFPVSLGSGLSLGDKTSASKTATFDTSSVENNNLQIFRPWIFLGELPLMTKRGHFILNGSPRVIVNQIARCPGIYFQEKRRGVGFEQEVRVSADLIPQRGPWLRIQSDWEGRFWARLKQEGRVKYATLYEAFQEFEKKYNSPLVSLLASRSSSFSKSEIIAFQERKTKEDRQKKALTRLFKNSTRYSLGKLGRIRINQRIHFRPLYELSQLEQNISLSNVSTLLLASLQKLITLNKANFFLKNNELASSRYPKPSTSFGSEGMQRGLQKWLHSESSKPKRWRRNDSVTPHFFAGTDPFRASVESKATFGDPQNSEHFRNIALFTTSHLFGTTTAIPQGDCEAEAILSNIPYCYLRYAKFFPAIPSITFGSASPFATFGILPLPRLLRKPFALQGACYQYPSWACEVGYAGGLRTLRGSRASGGEKIGKRSIPKVLGLKEQIYGKHPFSNASYFWLLRKSVVNRTLSPTIPFGSVNNSITSLARLHRLRTFGLQTLPYGTKVQNPTNRLKGIVQEQDKSLESSGEANVKKIRFSDFLEMEKWLDYFSLTSTFIDQFGKIDSMASSLLALSPLVVQGHEPVSSLGRLQFLQALSSKTFAFSSLQLPLAISPYKVDYTDQRILLDNNNVGKAKKKKQVPLLPFLPLPRRGLLPAVCRERKEAQLPLRKTRRASGGGKPLRGCIPLATYIFAGMQGSAKNSTKFWIRKPFKLNAMHLICKWDSTTFGDKSSGSTYTQMGQNITEIKHQRIPKVTNAYPAVLRSSFRKTQKVTKQSAGKEESNSLLMAKDIDAIHVYLERLLEGQGFTDDIDHLKNRFIRTSGKLLQQQFELGLHRLTEVITPLLKNLLQNHFALLKDSGVLPTRRTSEVALGTRGIASATNTTNTTFGGTGGIGIQRGIKSLGNKTDGSQQPLEESLNTSVKSTVAPFRWLRTSKPINGAFREFFGSNPLSQYMDQTNPLAEVTHKRRLSSMGPGGIKRETAGMEVRGIHPTHYGRVCPIETPEGKNAGLVNSPTVYGRIGTYGFLETPLYQVLESQVQLKRWAFFSAQQEEDETRSLATCDTGLMRFNLLADVPIPVQTANNPLAHFQQVERNRVGYRALSPVQTISIATALIPFLEHDDANRALMGSNMQRQAIPLLLPERPIVGTGFEPLVVVESGQTLQATRLGCVSSINANSIIVHSIQSKGNEVKALPESVLRNAIDNEFSSALRILQSSRRLHSFHSAGRNGSKSKPRKASYLRYGNEVYGGMEGMETVSKRIHRRSECILSLHTRRVSTKNSKLTKTRLNLCSSHSAYFLAPVKKTLQPYQRSNQETCLHQRPLVQEGDWVQRGDFLADCSASHLGDLSLGKNVTVAYMPWEGYNFEDAIVISDRLVADDIYTSLHIERYEIKVNKNSQGKERITNRIPGTSRSLKHLDNSGIAHIASWVQPGDILIGKVVELKRPLSPYERLAWELASRLSPASPEREKWLNKVWLEDISLRLPPGIFGRVINSQIISTEWSDKEQKAYPLEVHIYLAVKRKIQIGDKLAGRHGNKGIVSTILPQQDMPYLGDGRNIDMVLNPLGVPSRMNLGQIFECLLGLAGSQLGCNFKITPFDEVAGGEASRSLVFLKLYQCRLIYKQQWLFTPTFPGKSKLFDGRTGEPFENWVTVGQAYMLKLIHMVDHKIHARSTGPYSLFTRQPVRGRSRRGGQRLGEMEVWAVEGFGAAYTLQEFLTIKSDDLKARTALQRSFYKQNDVTFGTIHISPGNPEAFKVLISELQALCLHIQM